jgi:transposase
VAIVMGLDQHRAQITADWLNTETGEVSRARLTPAHRDGVRRFLGRFAGERLEVALEATTGWRFVVEELEAVGADVHLAEPAETSSLRGSKKRAKTDRADARHLRELLMVGRLPEAWIPPGHLLDLRARVRLRHTLVDQRGEWQQRIQAVLYHHGVAQRRDLLTVEKRQWLEELIDLPAAAREQVTVALAVIDALDAQSEPLTRELRAYGRRQPGCRALMAHYGIGALTAVTILAELGDARRFSSSRHAVRYAGLDITVHQSDQRRAPGHLSRQGPPALRWALYEAAQLARRPSSPDHAYYEQAAARLGGNRACLASLASCSSAATTRCANSETRPCKRPEPAHVRAQSSITPMRRGRLPACCCRHPHPVAGPERPSGRNASPSGITPSTITSPTGCTAGSRTEISPGARAHHNHVPDRPHAPPPSRRADHHNNDLAP